MCNSEVHKNNLKRKRNELNAGISHTKKFLICTNFDYCEDFHFRYQVVKRFACLFVCFILDDATMV